MAKVQSRNYTYEVPKINTKHLKSILSDVNGRCITNRNLKLLAQLKDDGYIHYTLANGRIVQGGIDKTVLSYGWRYWFICPCCQKRKAILHFTGRDIACRECFNLHYVSQSRDSLDRLGLRIYKLRRKIFGSISDDYNLYNSAHSIPKPKGIHNKRFKKEIAIISKLEWDRTMICDAMIEKLINKNPRFMRH